MDCILPAVPPRSPAAASLGREPAATGADAAGPFAIPPTWPPRAVRSRPAATAGPPRSRTFPKPACGCGWIAASSRAAVLAVEVPNEEGSAPTYFTKVMWVRQAGARKWCMGCAFKRELAPAELETLLGDKPVTVLIHPD